MFGIRRLAIGGVAFLGVLFSAQAVFAHGISAAQCGMNGIATALPVNYDPFTANTQQTFTGQITFHRFVHATDGQRKTDQVSFYVELPANSPAIEVSFSGTGVTANAGANVVWILPSAPAPNFSPTAPPARIANLEWGNHNSPDDITVNFTVKIPANANLAAGPLSFRIGYTCHGTGSFTGVSSAQFINNAITLNVNVRSALQAYYSGEAMAFGEIGLLGPGSTGLNTANSQRSGNINVRSSGPYSISLTATDSSFSMTQGDVAPSVTDDQRLDFSVSFMTATLTRVGTTSVSRTCQRGGLGTGHNLPITVNLLEGGMGHVPSPTYRDNLIVTVTPLAAGTAGSGAGCPAAAP